MENVRTSMDPGDEEQEGQHGPFPSPSLGLEVRKLREVGQMAIRACDFMTVWLEKFWLA